MNALPILFGKAGAAGAAGALFVASCLALRAEAAARPVLAGWDLGLSVVSVDPASVKRAVRMDPRRPDLLLAAGLACSVRADAQAAYLRRAIEASPARALPNLALSRHEALSGNGAAALWLLGVADRLDPNGSATQIRLAALARDQMRADEFLDHARRAVRLAPDQRLASALQLAAVVTSDPKVLASLVPSNPRHRLMAAREMERLGLDNAAAAQYAAASLGDSRSTPIHDDHVRFLLARGRRAAAIDLIRKHHSQPGDTRREQLLRLQLSQLLTDEKRFGEAADVIEQADAVEPRSGGVLEQRAVLALAMGEPGRAVDLARAAVAASAGEASPRVTLARALIGQGDIAGALSELAEAGRIEPARAEIHLLVARLSHVRGEATVASGRNE